MTQLELFFTILLTTQFFHSIEEASMGFNKKFPLFKMPLWTFLLFEAMFQGFFWFVLLNEAFGSRETFMHIFALLMFANGLWHIVWWGIIKKYVPGLATAPIFLIIFITFYFKIT